MNREIDEDIVLQAFLQEVLPKIERMVTRALRDGRALAELAIDLERGLDEKITGGCAPRQAVANRWLSHPHLDEVQRVALAHEILTTPPTAIPIAMTLLHEQFVLFGVRRLEGDVIAPAKPN
jgi:hypothetical protein